MNILLQNLGRSLSRQYFHKVKNEKLYYCLLSKGYWAIWSAELFAPLNSDKTSSFFFEILISWYIFTLFKL